MYEFYFIESAMTKMQINDVLKKSEVLFIKRRKVTVYKDQFK